MLSTVLTSLTNRGLVLALVGFSVAALCRDMPAGQQTEVAAAITDSLGYFGLLVAAIGRARLGFQPPPPPPPLPPAEAPAALGFVAAPVQRAGVSVFRQALGRLAGGQRIDALALRAMVAEAVAEGLRTAPAQGELFRVEPAQGNHSRMVMLGSVDSVPIAS